jgi:cell fate regulator YaaT (PSP1 superfamily)
MPLVIGVSFKRAGKIYLFNPGELQLAIGEQVVVETVRGVEMGRICTGIQNVEESDLAAPVKNVIRGATQEDMDKHYENSLKSTEAFKICVEKIKAHKLPMKLIDVEYTLDGNKAIFYFSAEGRIDFRNLVRDLASIFKKRIELHQIGVRDEAKLIGGLGPCGRPVCCATFMKEFDPVSIKMAKEQNLSLNPERISGTCGRLMCCLKHEYQFYHEALKGLPDVGSTIEIPEGNATVVDFSIPKRMIIVELSSKVRMEIPLEKIVAQKKE